MWRPRDLLKALQREAPYRPEVHRCVVKSYLGEEPVRGSDIPNDVQQVYIVESAATGFDTFLIIRGYQLRQLRQLLSTSTQFVRHSNPICDAFERKHEKEGTQSSTLSRTSDNSPSSSPSLAVDIEDIAADITDPGHHLLTTDVLPESQRTLRPSTVLNLLQPLNVCDRSIPASYLGEVSSRVEAKLFDQSMDGITRPKADTQINELMTQLTRQSNTPTEESLEEQYQQRPLQDDHDIDHPTNRRSSPQLSNSSPQQYIDEEVVWLVDDLHGLIVVHPDILVSSTSVGHTHHCLRRAYLMEKMGETQTKPVSHLQYEMVPLMGTIRHEYLQRQFTDQKYGMGTKSRQHLMQLELHQQQRGKAKEETLPLPLGPSFDSLTQSALSIIATSAPDDDPTPAAIKAMQYLITPSKPTPHSRDDTSSSFSIIVDKLKQPIQRMMMHRLREVATSGVLAMLGTTKEGRQRAVEEWKRSLEHHAGYCTFMLMQHLHYTVAACWLGAALCATIQSENPWPDTADSWVNDALRRGRRQIKEETTKDLTAALNVESHATTSTTAPSPSAAHFPSHPQVLTLDDVDEVDDCGNSSDHEDANIIHTDKDNRLKTGQASIPTFSQSARTTWDLSDLPALEWCEILDSGSDLTTLLNYNCNSRDCAREGNDGHTNIRQSRKGTTSKKDHRTIEEAVNLLCQRAINRSRQKDENDRDRSITTTSGIRHDHDVNMEGAKTVKVEPCHLSSPSTSSSSSSSSSSSFLSSLSNPPSSTTVLPALPLASAAPDPLFVSHHPSTHPQVVAISKLRLIAHPSIFHLGVSPRLVPTTLLPFCFTPSISSSPLSLPNTQHLCTLPRPSLLKLLGQTIIASNTLAHSVTTALGSLLACLAIFRSLVRSASYHSDLAQSVVRAHSIELAQFTSESVSSTVHVVPSLYEERGTLIRSLSTMAELTRTTNTVADNCTSDASCLTMYDDEEVAKDENVKKVSAYDMSWTSLMNAEEDGRSKVADSLSIPHDVSSLLRLFPYLNPLLLPQDISTENVQSIVSRLFEDPEGAAKAFAKIPLTTVSKSPLAISGDRQPDILPKPISIEPSALDRQVAAELHELNDIQDTLLKELASAESDSKGPPVLDIIGTEENVWSFIFGLKGKIDFTAIAHFPDTDSGKEREEECISPHKSDEVKRVGGSRQPMKIRLFPIELKTGKAREEHEQQALSYSLLLADRYRTFPSYSLLLYSKPFTSHDTGQNRHLKQVTFHQTNKGISSFLAYRNKLADALHVSDRHSGHPGISVIACPDCAKLNATSKETPHILLEAQVMRHTTPSTPPSASQPSRDQKSQRSRSVLTPAVLPPIIQNRFICRWCSVQDRCVFMHLTSDSNVTSQWRYTTPCQSLPPTLLAQGSSTLQSTSPKAASVSSSATLTTSTYLLHPPNPIKAEVSLHLLKLMGRSSHGTLLQTSLLKYAHTPIPLIRSTSSDRSTTQPASYSLPPGTSTLTPSTIPTNTTTSLAPITSPSTRQFESSRIYQLNEQSWSLLTDSLTPKHVAYARKWMRLLDEEHAGSYASRTRAWTQPADIARETFRTVDSVLLVGRRIVEDPVPIYEYVFLAPASLSYRTTPSTFSTPSLSTSLKSHPQDGFPSCAVSTSLLDTEFQPKDILHVSAYPEGTFLSHGEPWRLARLAKLTSFAPSIPRSASISSAFGSNSQSSTFTTPVQIALTEGELLRLSSSLLVLRFPGPTGPLDEYITYAEMIDLASVKQWLGKDIVDAVTRLTKYELEQLLCAHTASAEALSSDSDLTLNDIDNPKDGLPISQHVDLLSSQGSIIGILASLSSSQDNRKNLSQSSQEKKTHLARCLPLIRVAADEAIELEEKCSALRLNICAHCHSNCGTPSLPLQFPRILVQREDHQEPASCPYCDEASVLIDDPGSVLNESECIALLAQARLASMTCTWLPVTSNYTYRLDKDASSLVNTRRLQDNIIALLQPEPPGPTRIHPARLRALIIDGMDPAFEDWGPIERWISRYDAIGIDHLLVIASLYLKLLAEPAWAPSSTPANGDASKTDCLGQVDHSAKEYYLARNPPQSIEELPSEDIIISNRGNDSIGVNPTTVQFGASPPLSSSLSTSISGLATGLHWSHQEHQIFMRVIRTASLQSFLASCLPLDADVTDDRLMSYIHPSTLKTILAILGSPSRLVDKTEYGLSSSLPEDLLRPHSSLHNDLPIQSPAGTELGLSLNQTTLAMTECVMGSTRRPWPKRLLSFFLTYFDNIDVIAHNDHIPWPMGFVSFIESCAVLVRRLRALLLSPTNSANVKKAMDEDREEACEPQNSDAGQTPVTVDVAEGKRSPLDLATTDLDMVLSVSIRRILIERQGGWGLKGLVKDTPWGCPSSKPLQDEISEDALQIRLFYAPSIYPCSGDGSIVLSGIGSLPPCDNGNTFTHNNNNNHDHDPSTTAPTGLGPTSEHTGSHEWLHYSRSVSEAVTDAIVDLHSIDDVTVNKWEDILDKLEIQDRGSTALPAQASLTTNMTPQLPCPASPPSSSPATSPSANSFGVLSSMNDDDWAALDALVSATSSKAVSTPHPSESHTQTQPTPTHWSHPGSLGVSRITDTRPPLGPLPLGSPVTYSASAPNPSLPKPSPSIFSSSAPFSSSTLASCPSASNEFDWSEFDKSLSAQDLHQPTTAPSEQVSARASPSPRKLLIDRLSRVKCTPRNLLLKPGSGSILGHFQQGSTNKDDPRHLSPSPLSKPEEPSIHDLATYLSLSATGESGRILRRLAALNTDQRRCIDMVLASKDFMCINGFPGTGKTSTLAVLIHLLVLLGTRVLLCAFTNPAVDNVLLKLTEDEGLVDRQAIVRLGSGSSIDPRVSYLVGRMDGKPKPHVKVVASSAFGMYKIPSTEAFDFVIIDEASQISVPACLGPLRYLSAKGRFLLVGDLNQLPPLVRSLSAKLGGLDESLFSILLRRNSCRMSSAQTPQSTSSPNMPTSSSPPTPVSSLLRTLTLNAPYRDRSGNLQLQSVAALTMQYRMSKEIVYLSNRTIYGGALQCASDKVANQRLQTPNIADVSLEALLGNQLCLPSRDTVLPSAVSALSISSLLHEPLPGEKRKLEATAESSDFGTSTTSYPVSKRLRLSSSEADNTNDERVLGIAIGAQAASIHDVDDSPSASEFAGLDACPYGPTTGQRSTDWLFRAVSPDYPVVFIDTSLIPCPEMKRSSDRTTAPSTTAHQPSGVNSTPSIPIPSRTSPSSSRSLEPLSPPVSTDARSSSIYNPVEAKIVQLIVRSLLAVGVSGGEIGVISPYRAQLQYLTPLIQATSDEYAAEVVRSKFGVTIEWVTPENVEKAMADIQHNISTSSPLPNDPAQSITESLDKGQGSKVIETRSSATSPKVRHVMPCVMQLLSPLLHADRTPRLGGATLHTVTTPYSSIEGVAAKLKSTLTGQHSDQHLSRITSHQHPTLKMQSPVSILELKHYVGALVKALSPQIEVEIQTIDKFQGRDKNVIIISLVRSRNTLSESMTFTPTDYPGAKRSSSNASLNSSTRNDQAQPSSTSPFFSSLFPRSKSTVGSLLNDWRRINVMLTRAKAKLILVGNVNTLEESRDELIRAESGGTSGLAGKTTGKETKYDVDTSHVTSTLPTCVTDDKEEGIDVIIPEGTMLQKCISICRQKGWLVTIPPRHPLPSGRETADTKTF